MEKNRVSLFTKENYLWMGIGAAVMLLGLLLMAGGKSSDPNIFNHFKAMEASLFL